MDKKRNIKKSVEKCLAEFTTSDFLCYLFAITKNNWPMYKIYPIFKELKEKFPRDKNLSKLYFYPLAGSHHSRELERYLDTFMTWGIIYNNASQFTPYFMDSEVKEFELNNFEKLPVKRQEYLKGIAKTLDRLIESE